MGKGPGIISLSDHLEVICGPLLNFKSMNSDADESTSDWHGSVLIVTKPGQKQPILNLRPLGPVMPREPGSQISGDTSLPPEATVKGVKLYADRDKAFWRFSLDVPIEEYEARWEYDIPRFQYCNADQISHAPWKFVVPLAQQSMRIMFHSCNGFSIGTDLDVWQGPNLWKDVLRRHEQRPFHVMIGGGDQIYNDQVRVDGPLKSWVDITNPSKRRNHQFPSTMRDGCDEYYYKNYVKWYSTEPFAKANAQIPQVNIWDDHDIIDGFGSYTNHFMKCPVFRGIGGVAFKYYVLFQHHHAPPQSTYTTDCGATTTGEKGGTAGADPRQLEHSYVLQEGEEDPSWIVGPRPGPYVEEKSRNLFMRLGRRIAFIGIDARTERTRHQINYPETYELIFKRLERELSASKGEIKHIIVLLGVPIAYPRLVWLENFFTSPLLGPLRFLNRRFGVGGDLFNHFDGQIDLLDDLDDHYTSRHHKRERRELIQHLQRIAKQYSARVTILGGDVHLAAMGRFYSKPKLNIAVENDHRYMANVISSAITNKPPPAPVANLLSRRNKIHHMDHDTDETLLKIFNEQPGGNMKSASYNKVTMPSRNYATITEVTPAEANGPNVRDRPFTLPKDGHYPLHHGEVDAGTTYGAADGISSASGQPYGLDISFRVEIDSKDPEGNTEGYGFSGMSDSPMGTVFGCMILTCYSPAFDHPPRRTSERYKSCIETALHAFAERGEAAVHLILDQNMAELLLPAPCPESPTICPKFPTLQGFQTRVLF